MLPCGIANATAINPNPIVSNAIIIAAERPIFFTTGPHTNPKTAANKIDHTSKLETCAESSPNTSNPIAFTPAFSV